MELKFYFDRKIRIFLNDSGGHINYDSNAKTYVLSYGQQIFIDVYWVAPLPNYFIEINEQVEPNKNFIFKAII